MCEVAVVQTGLIDEDVGVCVAEGDDVFGCGDEGGCFEEGIGLRRRGGVLGGKGAGAQEKRLGHDMREQRWKEDETHLDADIRKKGEVSLKAETRGSSTASAVSWKCIVEAVRFNSGFRETRADTSLTRCLMSSWRFA